MLRVRFSALLPDKDGKLHYRGVLFSGFAYHVSDDGIVGPIEIVDQGAVTGTSTDWIDVPEGGTRVDWSFLREEEDYGPMLLRGVPFTGVAYTFARDGACLAEVEHLGGHDVRPHQRAWYPTGQPELVVTDSGSTAWFEDGHIARRATGGVMQYDLILDDSKRLAGIVLTDATLFDLAVVSRLTLADELMLLGCAIDTTLLKALRDHTRLGMIPELRLFETGLDPAAVGILTSFPGLSVLKLKGNAGLRLEDAREIKRRRPSWVVVFDRTTI